ncbi:PRC-barrel domain-containing protein [Paracoccus sp. (in: a-proteobacteria)]|uniref:PRC-barrel domain-containing protein n=1 Tax=Paracoccus sp. TaxID=267 RepID=UPI00321F9AFB
MKPLALAAATLALAGAALAQGATTPPPAPPAAQVQDAAGAAENAASRVIEAAEQAAGEAGQATTTAVTEAVTEAATEAEGEAEAGAAAPDAAKAAADAAPSAAPAAPVVAPDVKAPAISEAAPGVTSSWVTSRRIWTTNQPSSTEWVAPSVTERPAEWRDIAKVNDIVLDDAGMVVGYVADIGGFLGIGAKKVLLGKDAIHLVTLGEHTFFLTNYTKAELEALPDFDEKTVRK